MANESVRMFALATRVSPLMAFNSIKGNFTEFLIKPVTTGNGIKTKFDAGIRVAESSGDDGFRGDVELRRYVDMQSMNETTEN